MDEIDAMKAISAAFQALDDEARRRVLAWTVAKFGSPNVPGVATGAPSSTTMLKGGDSPKASQNKAKTVAGNKGGKKAKSVISMDKSLNLSPSGKQSAIEFANQKKPSSAEQKCVVACYYLRDVIEIDAIAVGGVFTFFKTVGWKIPADLRNTLQKAGSRGWLDTAQGDDIKITSMGDNLVEHDLPPTKE